ncbi:MAG: hypothetical protein LBK23_04230 [Oscillospiraceae bacterium]|jgi:hypothetical protein|nr:hypothetical protein [Oscillospiraceae bacterium]
MRVGDRYYGFDQPGGDIHISGIALPRFESFYFNTKAPPAMSDAEYRDAIIEQAKKDAANGKFQTESPEFKRLLKSYVSVVSPDRKSIITKGLNMLFSKNSQAAAEKTRHLTLIEILLGERFFTEEGRLKYAEFKDSNGNMVANYANGGWNSYETAAEGARSQEFLQLYTATWRSVYHGKHGADNGYSEIGPGFYIEV